MSVNEETEWYEHINEIIEECHGEKSTRRPRKRWGDNLTIEEQ